MVLIMCIKVQHVANTPKSLHSIRHHNSLTKIKTIETTESDIRYT